MAAAATLFGTAGVARGLGPADITPTFAATARAALGGAALVAVSAARGDAPWRGPLRLGWTLLGGVAVVGYQVAFFAAAARVGVGPAAVVTIGTGPVVAGLLDASIGGRSPSARWVTGVAVAVGGIVALSAGAPGSAGSALGWAYAVLAGCCYPTYGLAAQRLMADRGAVAAIATVFGAGAVLTLPALVVSASGVELSAGSVATVAWLGLAATALAYGLWSVGLHRLTLSDTVAVTLAEPVAAVVGAALLLDEPLSGRSVAAMVVVLAGVALATTGGRRQARSSSANSTAERRDDLAR